MLNLYGYFKTSSVYSRIITLVATTSSVPFLLQRSTHLECEEVQVLIPLICLLICVDLQVLVLLVCYHCNDWDILYLFVNFSCCLCLRVTRPCKGNGIIPDISTAFEKYLSSFSFSFLVENYLFFSWRRQREVSANALIFSNPACAILCSFMRVFSNVSE